MISIFIWIVVLVLALWAFLIFAFTEKKELNDEQKKQFKKNFKSIYLLESKKEKIIDYDKLYHQILKWFGYEWNFWDILKLKPDEVDDLNKIWELHKLRNKLVHDFDSHDEKFLNKKVLEYEKEIKKLLS